MSISEFLDGSNSAGLVMEGGALSGEEGSVFSNLELRNKLQAE